MIWQTAFSIELWLGDPKRAEAMLDAHDRPGLRDAKEAEEASQWLRLRRDPTAKNVAAAIARLLAALSAEPRQDRLPAALSIAELGQTDAAYRLALGTTGDMDEANDRLLFRAGLSRFREDPRFTGVGGQARTLAHLAGHGRMARLLRHVTPSRLWTVWVRAPG